MYHRGSNPQLSGCWPVSKWLFTRTGLSRSRTGLVPFANWTVNYEMNKKNIILALPGLEPTPLGLLACQTYFFLLRFAFIFSRLLKKAFMYASCPRPWSRLRCPQMCPKRFRDGTGRAREWAWCGLRWNAAPIPGPPPSQGPGRPGAHACAASRRVLPLSLSLCSKTLKARRH